MEICGFCGREKVGVHGKCIKQAYQLKHGFGYNKYKNEEFDFLPI